MTEHKEGAGAEGQSEEDRERMWPGEKARTGARRPAPKRQTPVEALAVRQHFSGKTTMEEADHHRSASSPKPH